MTTSDLIRPFTLDYVIQRVFTDYYVFQFMDGTWRIADTTSHQWNGLPSLPRSVADGIHHSEESARNALAFARVTWISEVRRSHA